MIKTKADKVLNFFNTSKERDGRTVITIISVNTIKT